MTKPFNPKTKKVTTIGEELRFQREYYCYKNNVSLPLKIDSTIKENDERESLQDILYNFMDRNFDNNSEYATSYDILYAIENGRSKKKSDPYNPNSYFLRMFCLFKIYGFLDSMTILELLKDRYKLQPSFESSKNIIKDLESNYTLENFIRNRQKGKAIKVNINEGKARCSKDTYLKFCNEDEKEEIDRIYNEILKKEQYSYYYKKEHFNESLEELKEFKNWFEDFEKLLNNNKELANKLENDIDKLRKLDYIEFYNLMIKHKDLLNDISILNKFERLIKRYNKFLADDLILIDKTKIDNPEDTLMCGYIFTKERTILQNKMKQLSQIEKYYISLELGRDTSYIDSFINGTLQNINIDTLLKTLEYFNMQDEKFYNILNIIKRDFGNESMRYSYLETF